MPINYVITVDFHGFKLLVNKLHGVYIDVDHRYLNTVGGPGGYAKIDLHPGYQKLDGQESLDFVRFRHTDSDLYRLARQQLFLDALKDRLAAASPDRDPGLVGAVKGNVEVVKRGRRRAGDQAIIQSYVGLGYRLPPAISSGTQIQNLSDCGYLNAEVCASRRDISPPSQAFLHPDVTLPKRANAQALGIKKVRVPATKQLKPSQISTLVLNGTTVGGLARDTSYKLAVVGLPDGAAARDGASRERAARDELFEHVYFDPRAAEREAGGEAAAVAIGAAHERRAARRRRSRRTRRMRATR